MGDMQCNGHGDRQNGHRDRQNHMSGSNNNSINTTEFIDYVHYLIEQCLVRYMSKQETLEILWQRERIDPELTILVWQKLEEDNPEFFAVYSILLNLKLQIVTFNHLLQRQIAMMSFLVPSMRSAAPMQKTTHAMPFENSSATQLQEPASALASEAEGGQSAPSIAPESFHYHTVSSLKDQNLFTRVKSEPVQSPVSMASNHNFPIDIPFPITHNVGVQNSSARQLQQPASALASEAEGGQSAPCIAPESFHYHTVSSLKDQNLFTRVKSEPVQSPVSMVSNHNFPMDTSKAGLMNKDALVNDANFMSLLEKLPQLRVTPGPSNGNTSDGITDPPEDLHYGEGSTELNDNPCPSIMEPSNQDNLSTSADCDDAVSKFQVEEPQMYAQNGEGMDPQQ